MRRYVLVTLEIVLLIACAVITALGVFPLPVIFFVLVGWGSLRARRMGWRDVGLRRPANWKLTIGMALLIGIGYQLLDIFAIAPLLQRLTGVPVDLSQFGLIEGNFAALIASLIITWTEASFLEEMFFRGYFFNRLTDLFGRQRLGIAISLLLSSIAFSLAHGYQGITGMLDALLAGIVLCALYLYAGKNLWLPILTHGIIDTLAFLLIYAGLYPK